VRFITLNKVSGFLQRMDLVRKYGFAKTCIPGAGGGAVHHQGCVALSAARRCRPLSLAEVYDMELYDWKKVTNQTPPRQPPGSLDQPVLLLPS